MEGQPVTEMYFGGVFRRRAKLCEMPGIEVEQRASSPNSPISGYEYMLWEHEKIKMGQGLISSFQPSGLCAHSICGLLLRRPQHATKDVSM